MALHYTSPKPPANPGYRRLPARLAGLCSILLLLLACGARGNTGNPYPIVLVHGFIGWGPQEMGGYHYWGDNTPTRDYGPISDQVTDAPGRQGRQPKRAIVRLRRSAPVGRSFVVRKTPLPCREMRPDG